MANPRVTASVLRWWVEAGVDVFVDEAPRHWLQGNSLARPQVEEAAAQPELPETLARLVDWTLTDANSACFGPTTRRLAPFGVPGSAIMILTDMPEITDVDSGTLLSGDVGILFDAMLSAVGLTRDSVYCAPLCPARPTTGQIESKQLERLGQIARHHIRLAAPQHVWLLGQSTSRAVLGADVAGQPAKLHNINHEGGNVSAIASFHPRMLLQHMARKAKLWSDMQVLFGGLNK